MLSINEKPLKNQRKMSLNPEKDLIDIENEIQKLEKAKEEPIEENTVDIEAVMETIGYYLEHLEELLIHKPKPLKRAEYFGLLFEQPPTYDELVFGTPKLVPFIKKKGGSDTSLVLMGDPKVTQFESFLADLERLCLIYKVNK